MQFVEITNGKKTKDITEHTWDREQNARYKGWQPTGKVTGNPTARSFPTQAPTQGIASSAFLPPEVQRLRSEAPPAPTQDPAGEVVRVEPPTADNGASKAAAQVNAAATPPATAKVTRKYVRKQTT